MFERVVLPAPFSPSSACTSPAPASNVDVVVRDDAGEPLGDPGHADGRRRRGAGRTGASFSHVTEWGSFPHRAQPGGWTEETFPITPLTSHCIEYRSGSTLSVLPLGTISLPFWS